MHAFNEMFNALDATTSTNEKVEIMHKYFVSLTPNELRWAVNILAGRRSRRYMTSLKLKDALLTKVDIPDWLYQESHAHVGDGGETISLLLKAFLPNRKKGSDRSLSQWLEIEFPKLVKMEESERNTQVLEWWNEIGDDELFVFNKLLTGTFRVGVSEKLVLRALALALNVSESVLTHRFMGLKEIESHHLTQIDTNDQEVNASQPYPFFLAHPLEDKDLYALNPDEWIAQWKWDGIRCQIIRRQNQSFIWSRGEELINESFPDLLKFSERLPEGTVIDGEILIWRNGVESFNELQRRLGRKKPSSKMQKEFPAQCLVFDMLEWQGQDIREQSLDSRWQKVEELKAMNLEGFQFAENLSFDTSDDLEHLRSSARDKNSEGLMLKRRDSVYGIGRKRGAWWKYKVAPYTLDAVLIYAQAGSGRRSNLFTDYTFGLRGEDGQLVSFAKAYSGLDQGEIDELDRWIRRHTREKFGPARSVEPEQVFEIAFEGILPSSRHKSGIAVRFPRIMRWRRDKKIADINSVEDAKRLIDAH